MANGTNYSQADVLKMLMAKSAEKALKKKYDKDAEEALMTGGPQALAPYSETAMKMQEEGSENGQSESTGGTDEKQRTFLNKLLIAVGAGMASAGKSPGGLQLIGQLLQQQDPMERQKEQRLIGQENRRLRQEKVENIRNLGGTINYQEIPDLELETGLSSDALLSSGRAQRRKDGTGLNILSDKQYARFVEEGKFTPEEQKHIRTTAEEINAWAKVVRRLDEKGVSVDPKNFKVTFEKTDNPFLREMGITSIPAISALTRQVKDPELQAIYRDIELAFQKFRTRVTGAQASDKEIQRLRAVIVSLRDQPETFFRTISNFMDNSREDFDTLLQIKSAFGRDVSQFEGLLEGLPSVKSHGMKTKEIVPGFSSDEWEVVNE